MWEQKADADHPYAKNYQPDPEPPTTAVKGFSPHARLYPQLQLIHESQWNYIGNSDGRTIIQADLSIVGDMNYYYGPRK